MRARYPARVLLRGPVGGHVVDVTGLGPLFAPLDVWRVPLDVGTLVAVTIEGRRIVALDVMSPPPRGPSPLPDRRVHSERVPPRDLDFLQRKRRDWLRQLGHLR